MRTVMGALLVLAACKSELGSNGDGPGGGSPDAPGSIGDDASTTEVDAEVPLGPWSAPMPVPGASDPMISEDDALLDPSGMELIFAMNGPDGTKDLYRMRRETLTDPWSTPERLSMNAAGAAEQTPRLSENGKRMYFASNRDGTVGSLDIFSATRQNINEPFGNVTPVPNVNQAGSDRWFAPCADTKYIVISTREPDTDDDLYEGTLGAIPTRIPISSDQVERGIGLTPDCLTMYFGSNQGGTMQLYTTTRGSLNEPWPEEVPFLDVSIAGAAHEDPWISADGRTFLVTVLVNDQKDVYISTR